jgi:hypothetical protein
MDKRRKDIQELSNLDNRHLENMFIVKTDSDDNYYYDLTDSLYINPDTMDPLLFGSYDIKGGDTLYSISDKYYGTTNLWWVVGTTNRIDNPFDIENMVGTTIKIPIKSVVGEILAVISN